ncbi:hypothetical protein IF650_06080 [Cellulosimicrobium terreum]|nr:hypothetical protein [Cellulosimicrobium terreum]
MAWWEEERPSLEDQLADSSRPLSASRPEDDASGDWFAVPLWLALGAALAAAGVAVVVASSELALGALGVALFAWGAYFLSQYGVLGWYALQVPRLREQRIAADRLGGAAPTVSDLDVRSWRVPVRLSAAGIRVGLLGPGDGAAPHALRAARVVGGCCVVLMIGAFALGALALAFAGAAND